MSYRIHGTVELECETCGLTGHVDGGDTVRGTPVLTWWLEVRGEQCRSCFIAPLSDPSRESSAVRRDAHPTSRNASLEVLPRSGTQRMRILEHLAQRGPLGATDDELHHELGIHLSSIHPRRGELVDGGWLEESDLPERFTAQGCAAIVWILTARARAALALEL